MLIDHFAFVQHGVQRFGHGKQAYSDQHNLNAVQQLGDAAGVARLRRNLVEPDQACRQANEQRRHTAQRAFAQHRAHGGKRQQHQHEVLGRPQLDGQIGNDRRKQRDQHGGNGARHKRADGGGGQRRAGSPAFGHLVALHCGHHAGRLTRRVEQNRGGGAAVHRTVVDAGKKYHRGRSFNLDGDRQQHGYCYRRPDAGQHANSCAKRAADKTPEQIDRGGCSGKALHQLVKDIHLEPPG